MSDDDLIFGMQKLYMAHSGCVNIPHSNYMKALLHYVREHDMDQLSQQPKEKRIPMQLCMAEGDTWSITRVIANDGTMWSLHGAGTKWNRLPELPQD